MLTKHDAMIDTEAVPLPFLMGLRVATFLLNTGRALKAIELCKECLIFLNSKALGKEKQFCKIGYAAIYKRMFEAHYLLPDYTNAIKYGRKLLVIYHECGETALEGILTINLADIYKQQYKYEEAGELYERAINFMEEIGDRLGQAVAYERLGRMSYCLSEYIKAKEYFEKVLIITIETGERRGEAASYVNLANVFRSLGEYEKASDHLIQALAIYIETGNKAGEASSYENLGTVYFSLLECDKAKEYHEKALAIDIEIGNRAGEATSYGNLGTVFQSLGDYEKAKEYLDKALTIEIEIGDKEGEATLYVKLGTVFQSLGEYDKVKEYVGKALTMKVETGDRAGEAACYMILGTVFQSLGEHVIAEGYLEKALSISQAIGDIKKEITCFYDLAAVNLFQKENIQEALHYLQMCINKSEEMRCFLKESDQFKISFSDAWQFPYRSLSMLFCTKLKNPNNALFVLELARARVLADVMASQYSVERQSTANPKSWTDIENIIKKERNCACLYISYYNQVVFLWIVTTSGVIHFRRITVNVKFVGAGFAGSLDEFFAKSFRSFGVLPEEDCEDRSLCENELKQKSYQEEIHGALRLVENDDEEIQNPESDLSLYYRMLIGPVADLLENPEIIIVPDALLYQVPFAALTDGCGKFLSETYRIRIVPSLTTLELIQDCPADYHSQTGALIVGDPVVGRVRYKGRRQNFLPLPCARKEAEMIGELLGVQPLLGQHATKKAVIQEINSVSLIHFAAHGNAERGEITLSPVRTTSKIPREEDYLLTMSDISSVQLRAKLVVLSCCHSACGQIRAEGVIGIARAFLGSGARSVLVALWAIDDRATEQLMKHFYEHLVRGESASESLHETMKWMRDNGFTKVSEWAPFMLIGDNVTLDFEK